MCQACWESDGGHKIVNENTLRVGGMIAEALNLGCDYGVGHIVFADDNLDDESIRYCLNAPPRKDKSQGEQQEDDFAKEVLREMLALSWEERVSANAIGQGYFKPGDDDGPS